ADVLAGRNLTLALPDARKRYSAATPQQKGAAADLSYGTLRFYGEVNAYLEKLLEKPLSNEHITALLLVAIYQLLHDKADDFTVVNQAVTAASYAKPRWAKGLVNGVLRNFLRQKADIKRQISTNEVALYSYPQWWINKLKTQYPELENNQNSVPGNMSESHLLINQWPCGYKSILKTGNLHPPLILRVNVRQTSTEAYLQLLARQDIEAIHLGADAVMLENPIPVEQIPGFLDGVVSVQDYGAQMAAHLVSPEKGSRILDACAAPGGKTGHLLELFDIELTALDNDATRLQRVQSNLSRLKLSAELVLGDAATFKADKPFDYILADVPCSASGIVRRHVDIKWLRRETDIASFTQQQSAILQQLWQCLAKKGKLLYVTCSIFNEENQQQIDQFLQKNADASQLPLLLTKDVDNNIDTKYVQDAKSVQLIPNAQHDGLFYALLQKN
ncbi:MAG TPA: 16S rRNA (cytosine(967)-C(5))-methyltransferase RsmB, partial [Methylotenera sp.]|nr:16S rRNA (cytosine(967)-C(5))-methyltransferase RsmB [Methylotenera sp.]